MAHSQDLEMEWNELAKDIDAARLLSIEEGRHDDHCRGTSKGSGIYENDEGCWRWQADDGQNHDVPLGIMDAVCYMLPPTRDRLQRTLDKVKLLSADYKECLSMVGIVPFEHVYDHECQIKSRGNLTSLGSIYWLGNLEWSPSKFYKQHIKL